MLVTFELHQKSFFDLAAKEMSKAYESYKSSSEDYKDPFLQFWVYINPNLIPDSYIDTLKRVLIDEYGWRIVDIKKQLEERKIYIKTEV